MVGNFVENPRAFHLTQWGGVNCKPARRCLVNPEGDRNIFFVGDSHMHQYAAGLQRHFPSIQFTHLDNRCLYNTLSQCYAGKWQSSLHFIERKKEDWELLKTSKDVVIIGQSWGLLTTYFDPETGSEIRFDDIDRYVEFLVRELVEVESFLGKGRIIVFGEVNRTNSVLQPMSCISRPFVDIKKCKFAEKSFSVTFNEKMKEKLATQDIPFVSPTDATCGPKKCINVINNRPVYSDNVHLSIWGSRLIIGRLREQLADLFGDQ